MVRYIERTFLLSGVLGAASPRGRTKGRNQFKPYLSWGAASTPRNRRWVRLFGDRSNEFLDIKTSTGEPIGVGFDLIYNGVAKYILNFHAKQLKKKLRDDFLAVFREDQANAPIFFLSAMKLLIGQASTADEEKSLTDALLRARGQDASEYCFYLYQLIREHSTNAKDASDQIKQQRALVLNDVNRMVALRGELSWL